MTRRESPPGRAQAGRAWLPWLFVAIGLAGFVYAGLRIALSTSDDAPAAVPPAAEPVETAGGDWVAVDVVELHDVVRHKGRVHGEGMTEVRAPRGMRVPIVKIHVEPGDFVEEGDVLITFFREQIEKAIEKVKAEGRLDDARRFEGYLDHVQLKAPVAGQVYEIWRDVGHVPIDDGIPLVTLADRTGFVFVANVPEDAAARSAAIGTKVTVELDAGIGEVEGTVVALDATGSDAVPTVGGYTPVIVSLPETAGLEPDLAGVLLLPSSLRQVAVVPARAVEYHVETPVVRVWEDGEAVERTIKVGDRRGDDLVIEYGVFPGEKVFVPDVD